MKQLHVWRRLSHLQVLKLFNTSVYILPNDRQKAILLYGYTRSKVSNIRSNVSKNTRIWMTWTVHICTDWRVGHKRSQIFSNPNTRNSSHAQKHSNHVTILLRFRTIFDCRAVKTWRTCANFSFSGICLCSVKTFAEGKEEQEDTGKVWRSRVFPVYLTGNTRTAWVVWHINAQVNYDLPFLL